jgi:hypothetical protein
VGTTGSAREPTLLLRLARGALPAWHATVEARRDHRDANLVAKAVVDDGAEDDVGVGVCRLGDELGRLVDLEQAEVGPTGDREQDAVRTVDGRLQQRTGDGHLRRGHRPVLAARRPDAHQRRPRVGHHALDVGEVEVDQPWCGDEVGDARDTLQEHLVGLLERVEHAHLPVADRQQPVVGDDDEGVHLVAQGVDAVLGLGGALLALERERPGDDADSQCAERPGDPGDDRRAAGAGAATFTGGDEHHVGALEHLFDVLGVVLGRLVADIGVGAGTEAARELASDVELDVGVAHQERLRVGVDCDELDALEADLDHPVDRVDTSAADADDLDDREVVLRCRHDLRLS